MKLLLSNSATLVVGTGDLVALAARDAALLVWLAVEGPTARGRLAKLLWPDSDPEAARNVLRQRLFKLRRLAGADVVTGSAVLALADGVEHDLDAAATVLGPFAADDCAPGEFAQWLEAQRARRHDSTRRVLAESADTAERAKDWDEALVHARSLLALDPLSEDAHRRVIRLHYLAGDRSTALLAFDRCEQVLKDEVGAKPSAATMALLSMLLASAPSAPAPSRALPASISRPPRMVGRDAELRQACTAWSEKRVVWVIGEAGMGKSRLLHELAALHPGAVHVSARPGDEGVPFSSLARLLRAWHEPVAIERDRTLQLPAAPRPSPMAALLPASPTSPTAQRLAVQRGVIAALHNAVGAGLVAALIDDLHFADSASLEVLSWLLVSDDAPAMSWALAQRPIEEHAPLARTRDALLDERGLHEIRLRPLGVEQLAELVESLSLPDVDAAAVAVQLHRHTGGNPLFALETLRQAWVGGRIDVAGSASLPTPLGVARLIERRLAQLSAAAVRLARCAAIAGTDFSIELATRVLAATALDLADAWQELEQAQVFADGAFAHDLIYEATLASVPQPIARYLHAQIADDLEGHEGEPARLAHHRDRAGQWAAASAAYRSAADAALGGSQIVQAAAWLARAAECSEQAHDHAAQFAALQRRARLLSAYEFDAQALAAVAELEAVAATPLETVQAAVLRLDLQAMREDYAQVLDRAPAVIEAAAQLQCENLELWAARCWSDALCRERRAREAVDLMRRYSALAETVDDPDERFEYWMALGLALDYDGQLREALAAWPKARAAAEAAQRHDLAWQATLNHAATLSKIGHVRDSAAMGMHALRESRTRGELPRVRLAMSESTVAHRLRDIGHYGEALQMLQQAAAAWQDAPNPVEQALVEHRLAVVYQHLGQPERARRLLSEERPETQPGIATMRLVHRADVARQLGSDGMPLIREAMARAKDADDIYHRIATLFATWLLPPDEGEAMAASLALWAMSRERFGVALAGHVRAAACSLQQRATARALPHVDAALRLARDYQPETYYLPELWLVAGQVFVADHQPDQARNAVRTGREWVMRVHDEHVPSEFRASFLGRNAVNVELLALAARFDLSSNSDHWRT